MYYGITLFHLLTFVYLKVAVKGISKHAQQNQEADIEIVNDQYVKCSPQLF